MTCFFPQKAWYSPEFTEKGKRAIVFSRNQSTGSGVSLKLPCMKCIGCEERKLLDMSVRCVHERRVRGHHSWMVTLTYEDRHLPAHGSLAKQDLRNFFKRMWEEFPKDKEEFPDPPHGQFRYHAIGEYGSKRGRPHYHVLFFDLRLPDVRHAYDRKGRFPVYESMLLKELWPHGRIQIDEMNPNTAQYVCGYITQKLVKKGYDLETVDQMTGELSSVDPEFQVSSKAPAIGKEWFDRYALTDVYRGGAGSGILVDSVSGKKVEVAPPRYYDYLFEKVDPVECEKMRKARRLQALTRKHENTPERLRVRHEIAMAKRRRRDEARERRNNFSR